MRYKCGPLVKERREPENAININATFDSLNVINAYKQLAVKVCAEGFYARFDDCNTTRRLYGLIFVLAYIMSI